MQRKLIGWVLFIGLAIMLFLLLNKAPSPYASIPIDEFTMLLKADRVRSVTVETDRLIGEFSHPQTTGNQGERVQRFQVQLPAGTTQSWLFMQWLLDNRQNATVRVENHPNWLLQVIIPLIPWLLIFGFIWFFVFRKLRGAQSTEMKPWPVYFVPAPQGAAPPPPPLGTVATPQPPPPPTPPPTTPAPGGDN